MTEESKYTVKLGHGKTRKDFNVDLKFKKNLTEFSGEGRNKNNEKVKILNGKVFK